MRFSTSPKKNPGKPDGRRGRSERKPDSRLLEPIAKVLWAARKVCFFAFPGAISGHPAAGISLNPPGHAAIHPRSDGDRITFAVGSFETHNCLRIAALSAGPAA